MNIQQSDSQLDSSLDSFKDRPKRRDTHLQLREEFSKQMLKTQEICSNKSEFELMLKEMKNNNAYKLKKYQKIIQQDVKKPIIVAELENFTFSINKQDDSQPIICQETNKQLQIHIDELVKSINKKKQSIFPMEHEMKLLQYQEKQAKDELILAEFELAKSNQLLQSMKMQIQQLQHKRTRYLGDLMDKNNAQRAFTEENKRDYQIVEDQVNRLKQQICEQKQQIEELKQQERTKWESSGNQMIIMKNYLAMTKVYEYCSNITEKIEISEECFEVTDDQSEDQILELESSELSMNEEGIFQTQIKQSTQKSKQSSKSLRSSRRIQKTNINYQQSLKNFITAKELISQVKQDVGISIIEEVILKEYQKGAAQQNQLAEQHTFLIEQRDDCLKELNNLYSKLFLGDELNQERIIKCNKPQDDNFNQIIITPNIAQSRVTNKLKIIQSLSKKIQMEELFLCLNSRAALFLQRIINLLNNISSRSEIMNLDLVQIYQSASMNLTFMKQQQQQCTFDEYPSFKQFIKSSNLALLYQDRQIFEEYISYCAQISDSKNPEENILIEHFDAFIQLCFNKIVFESQFIYEQITMIFNNMKKEIEKLNHFCYHQNEDLISFPQVVQLSYNMAAEKLQNYTDSKLSEPNGTLKKKLTIKKSELMDDLNSQQDEGKDENYEQYYLQIKNEIENPSTKRETQTDSTSIAKTTLLYENQTPRGEFIKQNRKLASSLNWIQSLSHIYNQISNREQSINFRFALNKEQKTIQFLTNTSQQTRRGSQSLAMTQTFRQQCHTEHTENKVKPQQVKHLMPKVALIDAERSLKNIKKISKLKFTH